MTAPFVERARVGAQAWLGAQDAPESAIVAGEAGIAGSDADAERWVARIIHDQAPDGSWEGSLMRTADALLTIQELREAAGLKTQDPAVGRAFDWLASRRGAPGAWSDGCSPERHGRGLCHHFLGGFLSPSPAEEPCEPTWLPSGAPVETDAEVRLVSSILALRALLRWGQATRDAGLHLEGLRRLVLLWDQGAPPGLTTTALLAAVHVLLLSDDPEDRAAAEHGLRLIGGKQRGDGSWVETDAFQALEVIGLAVEAGIEPELARRALDHGARLLASTQQRDGSWGDPRRTRRALIAWRILRLAET